MSDLYGRLMPSSKKQLNDKAEYLKKQTDALEKKLEAVQKTADRTEKNWSRRWTLRKWLFRYLRRESAE